MDPTSTPATPLGPSVVFQDMPADRFFRSAVMVGVVDGDTIDVDIDLGWSMTFRERLRLEAVNTPEKRGAERDAGEWLSELVARELPVGEALMIASTVYDRTGRVRGRYGRTIAAVYRVRDGWCLNRDLLERKLAWPTDDRGSIIGERSLSALTGLPAHLRGG